MPERPVSSASGKAAIASNPHSVPAHASSISPSGVRA